MKKRLSYYKGVCLCFAGRLVSPVVARFVEREIRRTFKGRTIAGTAEWFDGEDRATAYAFAQMTARMQAQLITGIAA